MKKSCSARSRRASAIAGAVAALFAASYPLSPIANPTGAQVVSGAVSVNSPAAGQMNITQKTPNAIVNWNSFSIGSNESVVIAQPSVSSALLNRVTGNDPSVIAGLLQANGKVFLVNPAGVIFAQGSVVNVGSMIASTLNIADADFLAGNFHFVGASPGAVVNQGSLTAQAGGTIALLGGTVSNSGTVTARLGTVALGAGGDITVDFAGDGLTTLQINRGVAGALLGNTGTLAADGGTVVMSAQSADALAGTVINQQGIVRAQSLSESNGHILLDGGTSGVTQLSGTLDASGGAGLSGGRVDVTGYDVALLNGAQINASGAIQGGTVRFGGGAGGADTDIRNAEAIWMSPSASIHADALASGNGGTVVAYSAEASRIYGTLSATGGPQGGNGGLIETSGHYLDTSGATIDASAPKGKGGTWQLDPASISIVAAASGTPATETPPNGGGTPTTFAPAAGTDSDVVNTLINNELSNGTSVMITTVGSTGGGTGDITIMAPISKTTTSVNSANPTTLTFSAVGSIIDNGQSIMSSAGPLSLVFDANVGGANSANVIQILGSEIVGTGGPQVTPVVLSTNGGDVMMGVKAGQPGSFDGAAVQLAYVDIDAQIGRDLTAPGGSVTIHGQSPAAPPLLLGGGAQANVPDLYAVGIFSSNIVTTAGSIELEGNLGSGTGTPVGGVYIGTALPPAGGVVPVAQLESTLATGAGAIRIYGIASDPVGTATYEADGVRISFGSTVKSETGPIDIRGGLVGTRTTENFVGDEGVQLGLSTIQVTGNDGSISIAGSSNSASPGLQMSSFIDGVQTGGPAISVGPGGSIVLRAGNDRTSDSFAFLGTGQLSSTNGTLSILPGLVDPTTFNITNSDATQINLFSTAAGLSISEAAFDSFTGFTTTILGSTTQTGKITVGGAGCDGVVPCADEPVFATNLTLANPGAGSQGIQLLYGASLPENTLTLSSAGPVSAPGGIQTTVGLLLAGPGTFTLTDPNNAVATLAMVGAGTVTFLNSAGFTIGPLTGQTFDSGVSAVTPINGANSTLVGNLSATAATGDVTVASSITENGGSGATATLSAAESLYVNKNIESTSGILNVVLDANSDASTGGYNVIQVENAQILTNGGNVTMGVVPNKPGTYDGASVTMGGATIDTRPNASPGTGNGSVTIVGFGANNPVYISDSTIVTSGGTIDIQGSIVGPSGVFYSGPGVELYGTTVQTDSGDIQIAGAGNAPAYYQQTGYGLELFNSVVHTNAGSIDVRGNYGFMALGTPNGTAVDIEQSQISASGSGATVSVAGSTNDSEPGVNVANNSSITAGLGGTVIVRAMNDTTSDAFTVTSSTISSNGGVLAILPGGVNATTFAFTSGDALPIGLFTNVAGLSIDEATFSTFTQFNTIVLGSSTQSGKITVGGAGCNGTVLCTQEPTFSTNLTLANPAAGSQGIDLLYGASLPANTLTLSSAAPVTDPGGIQAAGLLLAGPGSFTLTDPQNLVGVLAMANAGNVDFLNSGSFVIGPIVGKTLNSASNTVMPIDATNSTLTGNLVATAATGNIGLGRAMPMPTGPNTNLTSTGGSIDLVMEQGFFTDAGTGALSAANAWRVWAMTWNKETRGNVQPDTAQPNFYGCLFGAGCSWGGTVPTTGNHFVYVERPIVTVTADGVTRVVGAPNPTFGYSTTGLINGDTATGTLSGSLSSPATQASPAGQYPIDPSFASSVGYVVIDVPGTLTVTPQPPSHTNTNFDPVAQSGLQTFFGNDERTFVYENNLQGTNICVGANQPLFTTAPPGDTQDLLAVEWKRVRSQPNLNSCMVLNGQHGCGDF